MPILYPPGYVPTLGTRDDTAVLQELDRRCGYTQGEVRHVPVDQASAPPTPSKLEPKPSISIGQRPNKIGKGYQGGWASGKPGGCGDTAQSRKKKWAALGPGGAL